MDKYEIEEARVLSPEESAEARRQNAKPTGEAETTRQLHRFFLNAKPSMAMNRYEFEGVRGDVDVTSQGRNIKSRALFWYDKKTPKITLMVQGKPMSLSLIGRKGSDGLLTKFPIKPSKLRDEDSLNYLMGVTESSDEAEDAVFVITPNVYARVGGQMTVACENEAQAKEVIKEARSRLISAEIVDEIVDGDAVFEYAEWQDREPEEAPKKVSLTALATESRNDYPFYHETYTSAINAAIDYAKRKGYYIDQEEVADVVGLRSSRPRRGKTERVSIPLYKNEAESHMKAKKHLQVQVYNRGIEGNTFELNAYIA